MKCDERVIVYSICVETCCIKSVIIVEIMFEEERDQREKTTRKLNIFIYWDQSAIDREFFFFFFFAFLFFFLQTLIKHLLFPTSTSK